MKELIVKTPEGKPPFIGLVFDNEQKALIAQNLVTDHTDCEYTLDIYPLEKYGQLVRIPLIRTPTDSGNVYNILDIKIDVQSLYDFLQITSNCQFYNFGHVIEIGGQHRIVRVRNGKPFVLRIREISLVFSGGYETDTFSKIYPRAKNKFI